MEDVTGESKNAHGEVEDVSGEEDDDFSFGDAEDYVFDSSTEYSSFEMSETESENGSDTYKRLEKGM